MLSLIMNLLNEDSYQFQIFDSFVDAQVIRQFQLLKFDGSWQDVGAESEKNGNWMSQLDAVLCPECHYGLGTILWLVADTGLVTRCS